jgi:hypothetical protein
MKKYNIPSFWQILEKIILFVILLKFHEDLKLLSLFKGLLEKLILNLLHFLERLLWSVWMFAFRLGIRHWYLAGPNIPKSKRLDGLGIHLMHSG